MFRKIAWSMGTAVVLLGAMVVQAAAQSEKESVYPDQPDKIDTGFPLQQPSLVRETQHLPSVVLAASADGGARYFGTYQKAASFARSVSGKYYTSITKSGRTYRVDYWLKDSHG